MEPELLTTRNNDPNRLIRDLTINTNINNDESEEEEEEKIQTNRSQDTWSNFNN